MMSLKQLFFLFLAVLCCSACANFKINYSAAAKNWQTEQLAPNEEEPVYTVYLIGDAGGAAFDEVPPAIRLLNERLKGADENNAVIFLGDNIYRTGMAPEWAEIERASDEYKITVQMDAVKNFPGKVFFIPGNHDWYNWKLEGIERQAGFIEDYLDRDDVWYPEPGCGGPEVVELTEDLVVILVDSQWYLQDWEGLPDINDECDAKSREVFELEVGEAIKGNRDKNIIIALHHPLYTYGPHGGQYRAKDHLFPLSNLNNNLLIPLPVIGSAFNFLRATVGHEQDVSNPRYRELRNSLVGHARKNGRFVFASGHEHSLEYIERDSQVFVVSGSGSKRTAVRNGSGSDFSYAQYGWAKIDYYEDGSGWIEFWVPIGDGTEGEVVFRKQIRGPLPAKEEVNYEIYDEVEPNSTTTVPVSRDNFARGPLWSFLFGQHYREVYKSEVEVPVLDLKTFQGGLVPVKRGGGFQTNSLRLEAEDGRQFTMRSIDKDATRTIPYPFNQSFAVDLVKDNFSASHPFAALAIPPLATAAEVYHTNPRLYYVPRQPGLLAYNDDFGDALYLVEERPDDNCWQSEVCFGKPKDILSTRDVLNEVQDEQDDQIDQPWVVRSRLFDMLIGDWDRHDDQWRWSLIDTGKIEYYRPIPRDRDQAFAEYDGFVMSFVRNAMASSKQWRPYRGNIKPAKWGNYNARHFDPTFTSEMDWSDWEREAKYIQLHVTDQVIEAAFRDNWPKNIYDVSAGQIIESLKKRRDNLLDIARRYYLFRARKVDVVGTEKRELFEVDRLAKGRTLIRMYDTNKEGERQELLYERLFINSETKEINLFGLENDDIFRVKGQVDTGPKVRLIGGPGNDIFLDESKVAGGSRKNLVYDVVSEENQVEGGSETRVLIGDDPIYNSYDRKSKDYEYNFGNIFPFFSANPDDGFLVGLMGSYTTYGYRKQPYASRHNYGLNYALATRGIRVNYKGVFNDLMLSDWDLIVEGLAQTPFYSINFYGIGNDTPNPEVLNDAERDYNRVRQRLIELKPLLTKNSTTGGLAFGPTFESIRIDRTPGRYIDEVGDQFDPKTFEGMQFLGIRLQYEYTNLDQPALPTRGFSLKSEGGWKYRVGNINQHFPYLNASFSAYQRLDNLANLVFATQVGVQHRFSNDYEFFQAANLGGTGTDANFRGLRRNRYAGKTAFYQNMDLRLRLLGSKNRTLPFSLGILAGFDHGRVWLDKDVDNSETWHSSVGGGIWISPFNSFVLNLSLFRGDDNRNVFTFQGSFFF
jgi:hypothetical protein